MRLRCISVVLCIILLFGSSLIVPAFADETENNGSYSAEEFAQMAEQAQAYTFLLNGGLYHYWRLIYEYHLSTYAANWLNEQGYIPEQLVQKKSNELLPHIDRHTGELYDETDGSVFSMFPEDITLETLKSEYFNYFYYDIYEIFDCAHSHPIYGQPNGERCYNWYLTTDADGRVGVHNAEPPDYPEGCEGDVFWGSARITSQTDTRVTITMTEDLDYQPQEKTVEFVKTKAGWRIYGGTVFSWSGKPPQPPITGDNTPVFLTLTALSVFGLVALAVTVKRKEKMT